MYDSFSMNLEKATEAEASAQKNFEAVMAVKAKEMVTLVAQQRKKEEQKADYETELASLSVTLDDTSKQVSDDVALFDSLKESCSSKASEWSERVRSRTE